MNETLHNSCYGKMLAWLLPLETILLQYKIGSLNVGVLVMLAFLMLGSIHYRYFIIDKQFGAFIIVLVMQQILSVYIIGGDMNNRLNNILLVIMIFFACSSVMYDVIDIDYIMDKCVVIAAIIAIPIFIQTIQIYVLGQTVSAIMIFPQAEDNLLYWVTNAYRPSGFFTEAQTYCSYIMPFVAIALKRKRLWISIYLAISVLLTGSSLGIIVVAFLFVLYIFSNDIKLSRKILFIILLIFASAVFATVDLFSSAYDKITNIFNTFSHMSASNIASSGLYSNYLRMSKGWVTLFEMPVKDKFVGIGISGFRYYLSTNNIVFSWSSLWNVNSVNAAYYSSFAGVFIESGILVGIFFYMFVIAKIKAADSIGRLILVVFLLQSIFTQTYFNGVFVIYFLIYYTFSKPHQTLRFIVGK